MEKVWKGQPVADRATWRKPDVQVVRGNERIAFEVQLSTTFLLRSSDAVSFTELMAGQ